MPVASWQRAVRQLPTPPKFWAVGKLSENLIVVRKFCPKNKYLGLNTEHLEKNLKTKLKF